MGGFVLVRRGRAPDADDMLDTALGTFRDMGSPPAIEAEGDDYVFRYIPKTLDPRSQFLHREGGRFLAAVGTLVYRGRVGSEALQYLAQADDIAGAVADCRGHFLLINGGPQGVRLLRDRCAALEVFMDEDRGILSTSFLAIARSLPRRVLRRQEAYEYLFHGHALGTGTVLKGIRRLDEGETVTIDSAIRCTTPARWPVPEPAQGDRRTLAGQAVEVLSESLREVGTAFSGRASLALSGGYDTRLVLALARRIGLAPDLFVYGAPDSSDVVTAQHIASRESIALQHVDKSLLCSDVPEAEYLSTLRRNYLDADGIVYGGIFQPPAEAIARQMRHREGAVALHGGGGESFRNFFGIPNRPTTTSAIARLFFRVPADVAARGFSEAEHAAGIAAKMDATLGTAPGPLPRHVIEALYPRFRYRFWIGKELTLNARAGYSYMPLYDARSVELALAMPAHFKAHGNLEAEMIRIADPALAAYPSSYGHDFSRDAPMKDTLRDWVLQQRPAWLRQAMFRRASRGHTEARLWHEEWAGDMLGLDTPVMRELVSLPGMRRSECFENGCTLSVLIRDLGVSDVV